MDNKKNVHSCTIENTKNLEFDWKLYEKYLDDPDLTDEEKERIIETLWSIIINFIDLGFGIHPVQQVDKSNELESEIIRKLTKFHYDDREE